MKRLALAVSALCALSVAVLIAACSCSAKKVDINKEMIGNEIIISAFWPPSKGFANQKQYDYLKEANIDLLEWGSDPIFTDPDTLEKTLELCSSNGIMITVCDESFGDVTAKSDDELREIVKKYEKYDCVAGFFLRDEPQNANDYGRVVRVITEVMPGAICQMNMLPMGALADYQGHAEDWINAAGPENMRYLSFDQYPFGLEEGSVPQMFPNINAVRKTGLKYGVDTALYIQAVSSIGNFRKPTGSETRYHVSAALAYGYKNIKYFTWMTPVDRPGEVFSDAIIKPDGTPSDTYKDIVDINAKVKKVSKILGNLDAVTIYHSGRQDMGTEMLPDGWYVGAEDDNDFLVSLMADRSSGRNYLMFVNKNFTDSADITVSIKDITALEDVTGGAASAAPADISGGKLSMTVEAGGFKLYRLPENEDIRAERVYDESINLAKGKPVYSSFSVGENGYYTCKANDGLRVETDSARGWRLNGMNQSDTGWITVDLLRETDINRVDLYPDGRFGNENFARCFPLGFKIECSSDNESWNTVFETEEYVLPEAGAAEIHFDTVRVRYVRLSVTKYRVSYCAAVITEFEIYNDGGTVPAAMQPYIADTEQYAAMENIAKGKPASASSSYEADGWSVNNLTDGKPDGWSTMPGIHAADSEAPEWCLIDLGGSRTFNTFVIYPRQSLAGDYFPAETAIQISDDGYHWKDIALVEDDGLLVTFPRIVSTDRVTARYVRLLSHKMTMREASPDGYLMQLSEVEIYNVQ